ncbi:hypothetical protein [Halomonas denitrificans]|uniref:hypothetical protein n=1 Tax=Halomonas denitrificans TaxID=370769 RepID=UPI001C995E50|nr:hypothetical protein [Halomonas denitrificans]MBY5967268.1 hypothetical protein [Halomonas denitrificans]
MSECSLCDELQKKIGNVPEEYRELVSFGKNVIFESGGVFLIPSFGPLNHSHSMIVTGKHFNSFAQLPEADMKSARALIDDLQKRYFEGYGKRLVFFESGAGSVISHSGECISHAHIHCVEENLEFEKRLFDEVGFFNLNAVPKYSLDDEFGYVWYRAADGVEYAKNKPLLPSQFLRYLYMQYTSTPEKWNWRRNLNVEGVEMVLERYKTVFKNNVF